MAERRMFAKSLIDSDKFMDLPLAAQSVYFHLGMRADDDGFIGNAKGLVRMLRADEDTLGILAEKGLIKIFESGVVAISDWKAHNYIKKDRYKTTIYTSEKSQMDASVEPKENTPKQGEFSQAQKNVSKVETQVRIGKDSIGKVSTNTVTQNKEEALPLVQGEFCCEELQGTDLCVCDSDTDNDTDSKSSTSADNNADKHTDVRFMQIVELFNSMCTALPKVTVLTEKRQKDLNILLKKYSKEQIESVFTKVRTSDFLSGNGARGWKANFDWVIREDNFLKIYEGCYSRDPPKESVSYDLEAYERYSIFDE